MAPKKDPQAAQRASQRLSTKIKREDMKKKIAEERDGQKRQELEEQLNNMEVDEPNDNDYTMEDSDDAGIKPEESNNASTSLASVPEATTLTAGSLAIPSIEVTLPPDGSEGNPYPVDDDGDPVIPSGNLLGSQDRSLDGLAVETVAFRMWNVRGASTPRDYFNRYGPPGAGRWIISPTLHLKDKKFEELLDVSEKYNRLIDKPFRKDDKEAVRVTAKNFHSILIVIWEYDAGLSLKDRLAKLDPVIVKKADEYKTKKDREEARKAGVAFDKYPITYVKVKWQDESKSWELASQLRALFPRNPIGIETEIYKTAREQEERHEKWLNKDKGGRSYSQSPNPEPSTLRDTTPAAEDMQPSQEQATKATKSLTAIKTEEAKSPPAADTTTDLSLNLQTFLTGYKERNKIPKSTKLSDEQRESALNEWNKFQQALEAF